MPTGLEATHLTDYVFLADGTITAMQSAGPDIKTSFDLQNVFLDLHVVLEYLEATNNGKHQASGFLLVEYPDKEHVNDFCYFYLLF